MYSRGIIDLCEDDEHLIKTHLGEFGLFYEIEVGDKVKASKAYGGLSGEVVDIKGSFIVVKTKEGNQSYHESDLQVLNKEGVEVPLDLPMLYPDKYEPITEDIKTYGKVYESVNIENSYPIKDIENDGVSISFTFIDKHGIQRKLQMFKGNSIKLLWFNPTAQEWTTEDTPSKYEDDKVMNTFGKIMVKSILPKYGSFNFKALNAARYRLFRALIYNNLDKSQYEMDFDDQTMEIEVYSTLAEAEFRGKNVQLNKPKRGGSKAYYVYVKDPKTKRVKKVSFGSGGLRAKIRNSKARKAFAARHRCSSKKDRTSPGYWSCNLPRYAQALGLGANMNTFW